MSLLVGVRDSFEREYMAKFKALAAPYCEFVNYEHDRAGLDLGMHLLEAPRGSLGQTRVWAQFKGILRSTLSQDSFEQEQTVPQDLRINQLRYWYALPEATYLIVYIESVDTFLVEDIRDVIDRQWGESIFNPATFRPGQQEARVHIRTAAVLGPAIWERMLAHRSIRIDGPAFRGRPLGHRLDPLRCALAPMPPEVFTALVWRLLEVHGFRPTTTFEPTRIFPAIHETGDEVTLTLGTLHHSYEWTSQLFTELGFGPDDDFRIEGSMMQVQGPCVVCIHSKYASDPDRDALSTFAREISSVRHNDRDKEVRHLLAFVNTEPFAAAPIGAYRAATMGGLDCLPQLRGDLAYNLLIATNVYLEFRDKIAWEYVQFLA